MIIVTGCGRSGTSAVAGVLHGAGISMGHDLIEADESNAEGYFEERQVVVANDAVLNAAGLGQWFASATRQEILAAAEAYLEPMAEIAAAATPGWKDPRFSFTLEAWMPLLPSRPRIVVCLRNPAEVVASTLRYYGLAGDEAAGAAMHTWREECGRLLEIIGDYRLDATCVEFTSLCETPELAVESLARFVERPLDASGVKRDLRHHAQAIPDEAQELYGRVRSLAAPVGHT